MSDDEIPRTPGGGPGRALVTLLLLAAAGWFLVRFHAEKLYGTGPDEASRLVRTDVLMAAIGLHKTNPLLDAARQFGDPAHFPERLGPLKIAGGMLLFALLVGDGMLRLAAPALMRTPLARAVFAYGLGVGAESTLTLGLGLAGRLQDVRPDYWLYGAAAFWALALLRRSPRIEMAGDAERAGPAAPVALLAAAPFLLLSLCSALLPTPDYDSLAYHLLAPKEWWERGRIEFLPHNVYASFPFLTEMFHLLAMHLAGDWFLGGIAGQAFLWTFGLMGAVACAALTASVFGRRAGWLAFFIYATTPWIFRLGAIPYVEGATLFFFAAGLFAVRLAQQEVRGAVLLAGAMAGCAAATKYTNVLMVALPVGVLALLAARRQGMARAALVLCAGGALAFGPWLARNVAWTGNPVYPLAYSVFGGANWTESKAAKFAAGHRSTSFDWPALKRYLVEIPLESDWQSGLVFAFVPLALLAPGRRGFVALGGLLAAYVFGCFWTGTHRLDRFWLPLLVPIVALSAGGLAQARGAIGWIAAALVAAPYVYNLAYATTGACAPNQYGIPLAAHRVVAENANSGLQAITNAKARGEGVLYVGYSGVYYANHPSFYATVFDDNLLELWGESPARLRTELERRGIGWVAVDEKWIERYREPGSYGFTPFVTPAKFAEFESAGVLRREIVDGPYSLLRVVKAGP